MKKQLLLLAILSFVSFGAIAQIGSICTNPQPLGNHDTCMYNISINGPEYWLSFIPTSSLVSIKIASHVSGGIGHVHRLYIYSSCSSSTFDSASVNVNDSIYFFLQTLIPGNTYFLKGSTSIPGCPGCNSKANFDICIKNFVSPQSPACIWPGPYVCSEELGNGNFDYIDPNSTGSYWNAGCLTSLNIGPLANSQFFTPECPWLQMPDIICNGFGFSSSDFFNVCANTIVPPDPGVPTNAFGTQNDFNNNNTTGGYAGINTLAKGANCGADYYEGLYQDYRTPLLQGRVYYQEMYVSLAEISDIATTIGFSSFPIVPGAEQTYYNPANIINKNSWTHVEHCFYTVVGGETNFVITFVGSGQAITTGLTSNPGYTFSNPPFPTAYYYVDGVSTRLVADAGPDQTICNLGPVSLGCAYKPIIGATYSWTVSPSLGVTIANPNSQATTATFTSPGVYTFTLTVNSGLCGIVIDQAIITVAPISGSIVGPTTTCNITTANYTAPSGMSSYSWSVVTDGNVSVPFTSCGANCITINWAGFLAADCKCTATITCNMVNSAGCTAKMNLLVGACCTAGGSFFVDPSTSSPPFNVPVVTGNAFTINGTFIVNNNLTLQGVALDMGPQSQIHVMNGATLTIIDNGSTNPSQLFGCCDLWKGITLDAGTALVLNNSSIEDAEVAITSNGCANYTISNNAILNKNFRNIVVNQCVSHPGSIAQSTISCRDGATTKTYISTPANTLRCLEKTQITYSGIETYDVGNIAVGDPSLPGLFNTFDNMTIGIRSERSTITIKNNTFKNIKQMTFGPPPCCSSNSCPDPSVCIPPVTGVTIWAIGSTPAASPFVLTVGGAGVNDFNTIINCSNGVRTDNSMDILIQQNKFNLLTGIFDSGIGVLTQNDISPFSGTPHTERILGNMLTKFKTGIQTRFTSRSKILIANNNLSPAASATPTQRGIVVQDAFNLPNGFVKIQTNSIDNVKFGITATNIFGLLIDQVNTITFPLQVTNTTNPIYGIWVQNPPSSFAPTTVADNTVTKNGAGGSFASSGNWLGIRVDNTANITVDRNTINDMGSGIYVYQVCSNSTLACNKLNSCFYGFNFVGPADIGNQLPGAVDQFNRWTVTPPANRLVGATLGAPVWTYATTNGGLFNPGPALGTGITINPILLTNNICSTLPLFAVNINAAQRQQMFGAIAQNSNQYPMDSIEFKFASRTYAHSMFKNNPAWLSLNDPSDATFQHFYNTVNNSNIGKFAQVEDHIIAGDTINSLSLNNSIATSNLMESNMQSVNAIYCNMVSKSKFNYSSSDSATLYNIAVQNPLLGGFGVYRARVMLDLIVIDLGNNSNNQRVIQTQTENKNDLASKIYPNPNNGFMQMDYDMPANAKGQLMIYDLSGKIICTYVLTEGQNSLKIDQTKLDNGVYLYRLLMNGELIIADKLVIIK